MRVVDNRGLPCPQPVINTRNALKETGGPVVSVVDNEAARENVTRFARSQGYEVEVVQDGGTWRLTITPPGGGGKAAQAGQVSPAGATGPGSAAGGDAGDQPVGGGKPGGGEPGTGGQGRDGEPGGSAWVIVAGTDRLGRGSDELGSALMRSFLYALTQVPSPPDVMVFVNAGVNLTTEGSPVLDELRLLQDGGTRVLSCGTCLDYFGLRDRLVVGTVTNMYEIAETLASARRLLCL